MMELIKKPAAKWVFGGFLTLIILYFVFRDKVDSKIVTAMDYEFDTSPESLDENKVLSKGCRGGNVSALQEMLKSDGQELGSSGPNKDGIDGVFGAKTEKALMNAKGVTKISLNAYRKMPLLISKIEKDLLVGPMPDPTLILENSN